MGSQSPILKLSFLSVKKCYAAAGNEVFRFMRPLDPMMSISDIRAFLSEKLSQFVPSLEVSYKAELIHEINILKMEKNAVILGHNYMEPALFHTVTDIHGDSLELSRRATTVDQRIIVFCGVKFM